MTGVQGRSRVGGISDKGIQGVGHLVAKDRELVHGHPGLVFPVDRLVGDQAGSRDHVGGHAIGDEEDNVLRLGALRRVADNPVGGGGGAIVVGQHGLVLARTVEGDATVGLGGDLDERGFLRVLCKEIYAALGQRGTAHCVRLEILTLIPGEIPPLELRGLNIPELLWGLWLAVPSLAGNGKGEVGIRASLACLGAVDGRVHLQPDVEVLAGEEVGLVGREDAAQVGTGAQALEGLRGDGRGEEGKARNDGAGGGLHGDDLAETPRREKMNEKRKRRTTRGAWSI